MTENPISIQASVIQKITFASQQNNVAIINKLAIKSSSSDALENLILRFKTDPEIIQANDWTIDRINPDGTLTIEKRSVELNASQLHSLTERVNCVASFELLQGEKVLAAEKHQIEVLARNEWGGADHMPELLGAFIMPNDPAVEVILKKASKVLLSAGENGSIDGYQSKSRKRVYTLASAIWNAVAAQQLTYANPPASFELVGQKIRTPSHVLESGLSTCLDTTTLFAAALEQAGINAVIVLTKGHAFCGAWLQPQSFQTLTTDDPIEIRKHIAAKELILFETTLVTNAPPARFAEALKRGNMHVAENVEDEFVYALDVKQARVRSISPLPSFDQSLNHKSDEVETSVELGLDSPPELPSFDFGIELDNAVPDTPETRIDHWRRKLLDLTKRNRLLNLKPTKTAIKLICPNPAALEDKLAAEQKIRVIPREDLSGETGERDGDLYTDQTGKNYLEEFAAKAMERNQIVANIDAKDLERGMIELYRKSRADMREGGANTLFLAIGVLRWKQAQDDPNSYRAPLLLVPVKLERKSARSQVEIVHHDDEPVFNMTLLEMLRQDFEIEIPALKGDLPEDESGIDVPSVLEIMRRAIKDVPGFEVKEEVVISTFSFAKYLMWKDLTDRTEDLKGNTLVNHLIETPREEYQNQADFLEPTSIDQTIDPAEIFIPLPADSSQIIAIHSSGMGQDFILEGPPGTGKSQTIANMVAHNIALGRKVLFVSEKIAALNVVYSRLKQFGLGEFCLELHSNKTNKKEVIDHLGRSWKNREKLTAKEWSAETSRLKKLRDELNDIVDAIHQASPSGLSPYRAIGRAVRYQNLHQLELSWGKSLASDPIQSPEDKAALEEIVFDLAQAYSEISGASTDSLELIHQKDWSYAWTDQMISAAKSFKLACEGVSTAAATLLAELKFEDYAIDLASIEQLKIAAKALLSLISMAVKYDLSLSLDPDMDDTVDTIKAAHDLVLEYRAKAESLPIKLDLDTIRKVSATTLKAQWDEAETKFFISKFFKQRSIKKKLQTQANTQALNPAKDITSLIELQSLADQIDKLSKCVPSVLIWRGIKSDLNQVTEQVKACVLLKNVISKLATNAQQFIALKQAVDQNLIKGREFIAHGGSFKVAAEKLLENADNFADQKTTFEETADGQLHAITLENLETKLQTIINAQPALAAWCRWQFQKHKAIGNHLEDVVNALTEGSLPHGDAVDQFKTAYAKWLAPKLIDSREHLRTFSALNHQTKVEKFRALDQKISELSVDYIRAKVAGEMPAFEGENRHKGFNTLQHEMNKQRSHKSVRELVSALGEVLTGLTPCILMSPLSIAQFLPADIKLFDLVIFDEASQITVWDAVGSIARADNVIIVGDPKQMPPTSFFDRGADEDDDENQSILDQESILTEALAAGVKLHRLTGHYRSQHESLIAFSNHAYYNGDLITYPSSQIKESAVTFRHVEDGLYQRGARTNEKEAKALAAEVIRRLNNPELQKQSIGIVTMNTEQQRLIADLLDKERRQDPALEEYFREDNPNHVFVRNLETVQGDERNVIMISIGFGPTVPGIKTVSVNFGVLNRKGGERRLNVLITRASMEKVIFGSFDPSMIDLSRTSSKAVHDLKNYLEFAQKGPRALGEAVTSIGGLNDYDSDFERSVAEGLRARGWIVHTQIGVSKFRIDLGIVHPEKPGEYLVGIECDGATYHSLPAARDRDRVRHAILESLGWTLLRLWSTDYFQDPNGALDKLSGGIQETLAAAEKAEAEALQAREEAKVAASR